LSNDNGKRGPYLLDPGREAILIEAARSFLPWADQAAVAGVSDRTYRYWRSAAKRGEEPYATLMGKVFAAQAAGKGRILRRMHEQSEENWVVGAWLLERRDPANFSLVAALRPEAKEDESSTSHEARKAKILEDYAATGGRARHEARRRAMEQIRAEIATEGGDE